MYTDLCLRASLYSSFTSGKGLSGDLLILVLSSLISKRPVFDFWRAATMTLLSVVKVFSLEKNNRKTENKSHSPRLTGAPFINVIICLSIFSSGQ